MNNTEDNLDSEYDRFINTKYYCNPGPRPEPDVSFNYDKQIYHVANSMRYCFIRNKELIGLDIPDDLEHLETHINNFEHFKILMYYDEEIYIGEHEYNKYKDVNIEPFITLKYGYKNIEKNTTDEWFNITFKFTVNFEKAKYDNDWTASLACNCPYSCECRCWRHCDCNCDSSVIKTHGILYGITVEFSKDISNSNTDFSKIIKKLNGIFDRLHIHFMGKSFWSDSHKEYTFDDVKYEYIKKLN